MCLAEAYGDKETGDSIKWLEVIKEGTEKFPQQEYFVGNIMDYYIQKGMVDEGLAQINKLLATNETPYFLYVKVFCNSKRNNMMMLLLLLIKLSLMVVI